MISIIIPVYNVQDYIFKCLESVTAQTYQGDMECLIIDDCGQDNSVQLAEEFIASYIGKINFRIIHHEHNRGLSAARNTGIDESKGEWLYFLDSDDWIIPECIQLMMECVEKHPDVEMVCAGANVNSNDYPWLDYSKKELPSYSAARDFLQVSMLKRYDFGMTAWNKLTKTTFIKDNNLFFEEGYVNEDEIWNFRISGVIRRCGFVNQNTYNYLIRPHSIIREGSEQLYWDRHFSLWKKMLVFINGYQRKRQVQGLCDFIIEKTRSGYPSDRRLELSMLFFSLSVKTISLHSPLLILQGLFALLNNKLYNNHKITNRIIIPQE